MHLELQAAVPAISQICNCNSVYTVFIVTLCHLSKSSASLNKYIALLGEQFQVFKDIQSWGKWNDETRCQGCPNRAAHSLSELKWEEHVGEGTGVFKRCGTLPVLKLEYWGKLWAYSQLVGSKRNSYYQILYHATFLHMLKDFTPRDAIIWLIYPKWNNYFTDNATRNFT